MMRKDPLVVVLALSALFFVIFVGIVASWMSHLTSGSSQRQKLFFSQSNNIGVIELSGIILDSKKTLEQIESFEDNPLIKAVIIRLNSPGGAVAPAQEIYEAVQKLSKKKVVYSSMGSLAASGAYYIACGTKKIFANPGTITGSIGVIMQFADLSKLYQWAKVNPYNIKTGRYKDIGSPLKEMSPDEKQMLQKMVDNVLGQFRTVVVTGRHLPMAKVVAVSDGRIFSGEQAKEEKLVDALGGLNETAEALAKDVGITEKPHLVYPSKKTKWMTRFFEDDDDAESHSTISSFYTAVGPFLNLMKKIASSGGSLVDAVGGSSRVAVPHLVGPLFLMPYAVME